MRWEVDGTSKGFGFRMAPSTSHVLDEIVVGSRGLLLNEGPIDGSAFVEPETFHRRTKERSHPSLEIRSVIMQLESDGGSGALANVVGSWCTLVSPQWQFLLEAP